MHNTLTREKAPSLTHRNTQKHTPTTKYTTNTPTTPNKREPPAQQKPGQGLHKPKLQKWINTKHPKRVHNHHTTKENKKKRNTTPPTATTHPLYRPLARHPPSPTLQPPPLPSSPVPVSSIGSVPCFLFTCMCVFCSLVYVCASLLSMSLVFVVCFGFVSSFSCLCPPLCVCLSFSCIGFPCFLVGFLFLSVVGFLIRRACSCVCCLS